MTTIPAPAPTIVRRSRILALVALVPWGVGLALALNESSSRRLDPEDAWILGFMAVLALGAWCLGRATRPAAWTLALLSSIMLLAGAAAVTLSLMLMNANIVGM